VEAIPQDGFYALGVLTFEAEQVEGEGAAKGTFGVALEVDGKDDTGILRGMVPEGVRVWRSLLKEDGGTAVIARKERGKGLLMDKMIIYSGLNHHGTELLLSWLYISTPANLI